MLDNFKKLRFVLASAVLALAMLACRYPGLPGNLAQTEVPETKFATVAPDQPLLGVTPSGASTTYVLNEAQLNSVIQKALAAQPDLPVQNLQISLQEGAGTITGTAQQNGFELPLSVTLGASVDGQGGVIFQVESASVGFLPLPQSMLDQLSNQINQAMRSEIARATGNVFVESISIADGLLTVTGRTR
jgi:outer membrane protein TolC